MLPERPRPEIPDPETALALRLEEPKDLTALAEVSTELRLAAEALGMLMSHPDSTAEYAIRINGSEDVSGEIQMTRSPQGELLINIEGNLGRAEKTLPGTPHVAQYNGFFYRRPKPEKMRLANSGDKVKPGDEVGWRFVAKNNQSAVKVEEAGTIHFREEDFDERDRIKVEAGQTVIFYLEGQNAAKA